jgi:hypothetical protein
MEESRWEQSTKNHLEFQGGFFKSDHFFKLSSCPLLPDLQSWRQRGATS